MVVKFHAGEVIDKPGTTGTGNRERKRGEAPCFLLLERQLTKMFSLGSISSIFTYAGWGH